MKRKIILSGTIAIIFLVLLSIFTLIDNKSLDYKTDYKSLDLKNINKLMIVAHPDDEILWGGSKLIQEDFLVVCITCGKSNPSRVKEFKSVMDKTGDKYIMLDYPDKTNGKRNDWSKVKKDILNDLQNIYLLKEWKEVVTHNPLGEYGHIHHKMTSEYVTSIVRKERLKYFGKYYSKKKLEEENIVLLKMASDLIEKKKEVLSMYSSQKSTIESFDHMIGTENILTYEEWMGLYNE